MLPARHSSRLIAAVMAAAAAGFVAWLWWISHSNSQMAFLDHRASAEWILYPKPPAGLVHKPAELSTEFRRTFVLDRLPPQASLSIRAMKRWTATLNGVPISSNAGDSQNWKQPTALEVSPNLRAGTNEISVTVFNSNGPPALWLALNAGSVVIASGPDWDCSLWDAAWRKAVPATAPVIFVNGSTFFGGEKPLPSLLKHLLTFVIFGVFSAGLLVRGRGWLESYQTSGAPWGPVDSRKFATGVVAVAGLAWAVLFFNNLGLLPYSEGFDATFHLDYIQRIRTTWKLPLADEGWQTYQPPLYYLICAVLMLPFNATSYTANSIAVLRTFGLLVGIAHFALVFLSLRLLFRGRVGTQLFGLVLVALLPENIYLAHYITNEPLSAMLLTASIYFCLRILIEKRDSWINFFGVGACLGGALLTKFTAVIAIPIIGAALLADLLRKQKLHAPRNRSVMAENASAGVRPSPGAASYECRGTLDLTGAPALLDIAAPGDGRTPPTRDPAVSDAVHAPLWVCKVAFAFLVCGLVCGWHYLRVWRHFGSPLVGNWDAVAGFHWWMEPGYRTAAFFVRFGRCFTSPWFSSFDGFWDGLYSTLWGDGMIGGEVIMAHRPPWNYELMAAGFILAVVPTMLIVAGVVMAVRKFIREPNPAWFLLVGLAFSTLAALVYMNLKLPSYGQTKAFYGLLALLPLCAFGAMGWELVQRRGRTIVLIAGSLVGVWAMNNYGSFWIRGWKPEPYLVNGLVLIDAGFHDAAVQQYAEAQRRAPNNIEIKKFMIMELFGQHRIDEANKLAERGVKESPDDADFRFFHSWILGAQGQLDAAINEVRRATELAPDHAYAYQSLCEWLFQAGRYGESATAGREGLRVNPFSTNMQFQVGLSLAALGDRANAAAHFRYATLLRPEWPEAFYELGVSLDASGKAAEAITQFREALKFRPDYPPALSGLAWILATDSDQKLRNGTEAVQLAEHACDLAGRKNARLLGTLAATYAEAGRFEDAAATARQALEIMRAGGDTAVVGFTEKQLELYNSKRAYHREPVATPQGR